MDPAILSILPETILHALATTLQSFILPVIIGANTAALLRNHLSLKKLSEYDGCMLSTSAPVLKPLSEEEKTKTQKLIEECKTRAIQEAIQTVVANVEEKSLILLYRNLSTVKLKRNHFLIIDGTTGRYNSNTNTLIYALKSSLVHELIHLATTFKDPNTGYEYTGFTQTKKTYPVVGMHIATIGHGVSEGYTELLASRYEKKKPDSYKNEIKIVKLMEFFFDDPKDMEKMFYNCDLPGLISQLAKYSSKEEATKLILDVDHLLFYDKTIDNVMARITCTRLQTRLYRWFTAKNENPDKLNAFKQELYKDKVAKFMSEFEDYKVVNGLNRTR